MFHTVNGNTMSIRTRLMVATLIVLVVLQLSFSGISFSKSTHEDTKYLNSLQDKPAKFIDFPQQKEVSKLQCWRKSGLNGRGRFDLLITGCGYSSTGFFSKVLTAAGYPIGHEFMATHGTSDWRAAGRKNTIIHPFQFNHVVLLVRHPLKVLNSWFGTKWNFHIGGITELQEDSIMQDREAYHNISNEFKVLEWWLSFNLLGENIAECRMRSEDVGGELLQQLCNRAELPNCAKNWTEIADTLPKYNSHTKKQDSRATWDYLEEIASTDMEMAILNHTKHECLRFNYSDCGT